MTMGARIGRRSFVQFIALGAGGAAALAAGGLGFASLSHPSQPGTLLASTRSLPPRYRRALSVPPVLRPVRRDTSIDYYEITQRTSTVSIFDGIDTPVWTYNGSFPGPTIRSRSGRRCVVRHINQLARPVVVHLHGGHTPHDSDGYPADLIQPSQAAVALPATPARRPTIPATIGMTGPMMPGESTVGERLYTYPMNQRAATLWYHDHRMGFTGASVWHGLAGFHLINDAEEDALRLPAGDRDVPIMITDRSFDAQGRLQYPSLDPTLTTPGVTPAYMNGVLGDVVLVNGTPWPVLTVDRAHYRLRLLNASNARRYRLVLDPPPPGAGGLVQIGSDAGLLAHPITHDAVEVAPAERFDVVVDFSRYPAGQQVHLRNELASDSTTEVMRFDITDTTVLDDRPVPDTLSTSLVHLDPKSATITRDFLFQNRPGREGWTINGQPYDPTRPLAFPALGTTEIWRFVTDLHHPIHIHHSPFQILNRNGKQPGPYDHGWKDTIDLQPAQSASVLIRFPDYRGRFLLHCHNLEHEDMAMMADFLIT
jgi:spore coat protein A, manganese oxidase